MRDRRSFLQASLAAVAGMVVSRAFPARAANFGCPAGLIYTAADPGRWAGKESIHVPQVKREGNRVTITTPNHPMKASHYIVRHTLVGTDGQVLGDTTFFPTDKEAVSVHELPPGKEPKYATSFCNRHDFWVSEI